MLLTCRLAHLSVCVCASVCLSVWKVYCGKMAEWIQMPFGMVSGVGRCGDFAEYVCKSDALFSNYFEDLS